MRSCAEFYAAVELYESRQGKPNLELQAANERVILLQNELKEATLAVETIRKQGSFLDQLNGAVLKLESSVKILAAKYHNKVADELTSQLFGYDGGYANAAKATKDAVKQHRRLTVLRAFYVPNRPYTEPELTPEYLLDRARRAFEVVGRFKAHVALEAEEASKQA